MKNKENKTRFYMPEQDDEIDEETVDKEINTRMVLDRAGSKKMKKGRKIPKLKIVVLVVGGTILLAVGFFAFKYFAYDSAADRSGISLAKCVEKNEDVLYLDEALSEEEYMFLANEMQQLEDDILLRNELQELDLSKYQNYDADVLKSDISGLTVQDVRDMMMQYNAMKNNVDLSTPSKETIEFYTIVSGLTTYLDSLTDDVFVSSVDGLCNYADLLIKTTTCHALDFPIEKISYMETNLTDYSTNDLTIKYLEVETGRSYELRPTMLNSINSLVGEIRKLCILRDNGEMQSIKHQEEVVLNHIKNVMPYSFSVESGRIYQKGNNLTITNR